MWARVPTVTFPYFGTKNALARLYPAPIKGAPIIEPFAGAAGYACHWARKTEGQVMAYLYDKDPRVVEVWHWLQTDPVSFIREGDRIFSGDYTRTTYEGAWPYRWIAGAGGFANMNTATPWLRNEWRRHRQRVLDTVPFIRRWRIEHVNDYTEAPDMRGTWFIDPPYVPGKTKAGNEYVAGADGLDFVALGDWCRTRRGVDHCV